MKKLCFIALALVSLLAVQACNENRKAKNFNQKTQLDDQGVNLLIKATEGGDAEVALSKIALKNSTNQQVISFANMMITDHTEVGTQVKKIAADKFVTVSDNLTPEHKKLADSLALIKGTEFDKLYMQTMVNDHEKTVALFRDAQSNPDETVKAFTGKTLPKLEGHLKEANNLCTGLK